MGLTPLPALSWSRSFHRFHGECFGDAVAIRADLLWLQANGFTSSEPVTAPIEPAPFVEQSDTAPRHGGVNGGYSSLGDAPVFQRVFTLLRHQSGGILVDHAAPVRAFANRSIVSSALVRPDSLAAERQAERLETAIVERRRVELERYASVASFADSPSGVFRAWPLQLLFHNIGWYLIYEIDTVGHEEGLIRSERLDRLALRRSERPYRRSEEAQRAALARLQILLHLSGGIYFGNDLDAQRQLCSASSRHRAKAMTTLRFSCQSRSFAFIREGLQRYPLECTRYSQPLPGDIWWHHPKAPHVLEPGSPSDTHPYPVELDLPRWTVERDVDLRNWLFGFGDGIRVETPIELLAEHRQWLQRAAAVYQASDSIRPV